MDALLDRFRNDLAKASTVLDDHENRDRKKGRERS
jgi:hypothetical protein